MITMTVNEVSKKEEHFESKIKIHQLRKTSEVERTFQKMFSETLPKSLINLSKKIIKDQLDV